MRRARIVVNAFPPQNLAVAMIGKFSKIRRKEKMLTHMHVYNTHTSYDKFSFYFLTSVNCDAIYHKTNRPLYNAT